MHSDPEVKLVVGPVTNDEVSDRVQQPEGHSSNFPGVEISVPVRESGNDHVSIADRLHLPDKKIRIINVSKSIRETFEDDQPSLACLFNPDY